MNLKRVTMLDISMQKIIKLRLYLFISCLICVFTPMSFAQTNSAGANGVESIESAEG